MRIRPYTALLLALASVACAQPPPAARGIGLDAGALALPAFASDLDGGGRVHRSFIAADLQYRLPPLRGVLTRAGLEWERADYDFEGRAALNPLSGSADQVRLRLNLFATATNAWGWMLSPSLREAAFDGADAADGRTAHLLALATPPGPATRRASWSFGLIAQTHLEEGADVFPIVGVVWRITDRLTLRTSDEVTLRYEPDDRGRWQWEWRTSYRQREYRLPAADAAASGGVFSDRQVASALALRWRPRPFVSITAHAGLALAQKLRLEERDGDTVERIDADPAPAAGAEFRLRL